MVVINKECKVQPENDIQVLILFVKNVKLYQLHIFSFMIIN